MLCIQMPRAESTEHTHVLLRGLEPLPPERTSSGRGSWSGLCSAGC